MARHRVVITHPDKLYFPGGYRKVDMIRYYAAIAKWMLPHLRDRPVTLIRFPEGVRGEKFYEKNAPGHAPAWIRTFPVPRVHHDGDINYILVNNLETLVWCANLGAIEFHPFLHRAPRIGRPTHIAFDLDPGEGADLLTCIEVAGLLREVLAKLGLESFAKVSGSKGLQLYVPLNVPLTYEATTPFAKTVAELLAREHPKLVVSDMAKALRRRRVLIDWSQNSEAKTTVCVYSMRGKHDEPFVSCPVSWDELARASQRRDKDALYFSPDAALARAKKLGDLFAPVLTMKQRLPEAFMALSRKENERGGRRRKEEGEGRRETGGRRRQERRTASRPSRGGLPSGSASRRSQGRLPSGSLEDYARKRDFTKTAEPAPVVPRRSRQGSVRRFVIQKHAASHLHFDFRLEMGGTLKSWAVPKGLPYETGVKRSAFPTEDHPIEYLDFEGTIPAGQYGGGTVMVWDIGTYEIIDGNYYRGDLKIWLNGKKLKGEWHIFRIKGEEDKPVWLVIKGGKSMKPLSAKKEDQSVLTGRSMQRIARDDDRQWEGKEGGKGDGRTEEGGGRSGVAVVRKEGDGRKEAGDRRREDGGGRREAGGGTRGGRGQTRGKVDKERQSSGRVGSRDRPKFIEPMKPRLVERLPEGPEWIYEVKWDGFRALVLKHGDEVRLLSRNNKSLARDFPEVVAAVVGLGIRSCMIDGEIVALDPQGRPAFQALQNRATTDAAIVFYAFDLLAADGRDLTGRPLSERRNQLEDVLAGTELRLSRELGGSADAVVAAVRQLGLEGVVAKRRESAYRSGDRSSDWQKIRLRRGQEFVVGGYRPGMNPFESVLVGYYEGAKLIFAGKVRPGFTPHTRRQVWELIKDDEVARCPFANLPDAPGRRTRGGERRGRWGEGITPEEMKTLRWVRPKLAVDVEFVEWTSHGHLRHAAFRGIRPDKKPREVERENA